MVQKEFSQRVVEALHKDSSVVGLAAAGSWITDEIDEWSDLDLIVVTKETLDADKAKMLSYASRFGVLLSAFTGEHVGEKRLLICLYDNPLLHVDLKFVTLEEFKIRVEDPVVLLDTEDLLKNSISATQAAFPMPDFQWIEDRFWTWVHYGLLKIGRGEYFEAVDFMGYLRMVVFGPLLHLKNKNLPKGLRKVEVRLSKHDFGMLQSTLSSNDKQALLTSLRSAVELYRSLRSDLFDNSISFSKAEDAVMRYFNRS
jgi:predicted nucleotidyltransferase